MQALARWCAEHGRTGEVPPPDDGSAPLPPS
jgi:hypothetical protein